MKRGARDDNRPLDNTHRLLIYKKQQDKTTLEFATMRNQIPNVGVPYNNLILLVINLD